MNHDKFQKLIETKKKAIQAGCDKRIAALDKLAPPKFKVGDLVYWTDDKFCRKVLEVIIVTNELSRYEKNQFKYLYRLDREPDGDRHDSTSEEYLHLATEEERRKMQSVQEEAIKNDLEKIYNTVNSLRDIEVSKLFKRRASIQSAVSDLIDALESYDDDDGIDGAI